MKKSSPSETTPSKEPRQSRRPTAPAGGQELRLQAEAKLKQRKNKNESLNATDTLRLLHELQVHQIELEMQNEELAQARTEAEEAYRQYTDLYDFAPVGYLTLARDGAMRKINLAGASLLGTERGKLVNCRLGLLTSNASRPIFNAFFENLLSGQGKATCEVRFQKDGNESLWARLEATCFDGSQEARVVMVNITERKQAEEELRESEEKYRRIVETAGEGIWMIDTEGNTSFANQKMAEMLGCSVGDMLGVSFFNFMDEDGKAIAAVNLERRRQGIKEQHDFKFRRKDGTDLWAILETNPIRDRDGRYAGALAMITDITERKRVENELEESHRKLQEVNNDLQQAQSIAHIGNWRWDLRTSTVEWSDEMYRIFGIDKDSYSGRLGDAISKVIHPDDLYIVLPSNAPEFAMKKPQEYRIIHPKNGDVRHIWAKAGDAVLDEQGTPIYLTGIAQDITERKQAEEKLRESETRYRTLLESTSDSVYVLDREWRHIMVNEAATRFVQMPKAKLLDNKLTDLFPGIEETVFFKTFQRVMETRESDTTVAMYTFPDGKKGWYEVRVDPTPEGILCISRDITERKRAEDEIHQLNATLERRVEERTAELIRANRIKDEFLANMSHELRTPLNSVLGFSETLLEGIHGQITDKQSRAVEMIHTSGEHLLGLINDILDVSKIEAGKFELQLENVSVNAICQSSLMFVKQPALKKSVTVEYVPSPFASILFADPRRLKQILVNLLNNAVKFTPEHGTVKLEVREEVEAGQMVFSVTDNGIGIKPEDLEKLFKPFVQLDSKLSRAYEGTGLGLSLVKKLVELHGGTVEVESELGRGSCFHFNIPIRGAPITESEKTPIQHESNKKEVAGRGRRILLVEDNDVNMMVTSDYLTMKGYEVIQAFNGIEAIQLSKKSSPELILMDIQMPDMDGIETIKRLRAAPEFSTVKIIALTALAMPGDRERCLEAGANEYMSKPVSLKELVEVIGNLLQEQ